MGWRYKRSLNFGPLRLNLSKRGLGASVGAGPLRIGRSATGRRYRSIRIPGTGISHHTTVGRAKGTGLGCCLLLLGALGVAIGGAVAATASLGGVAQQGQRCPGPPAKWPST
jgi:hypothetical protein